MWLIYTWCFHWNGLIGESPFTIIRSWYVYHIFCWKPVLWFVAAIGFPQLADGGNRHPVTNSFELHWETYSRYWINSSKPFPTISWLASRYQLFAVGAPMKWVSHMFWLKPLRPVFCNLKSKFSLTLKIKHQQFNRNERPLNWYNLRPLLFFAGHYL